VRLLAFYLPQFHPIPENDAWWGKGFTEWRNVVAARPLFRGHYQPHLPADLGFYDLRLPEVRQAQADLAVKYGIQGFCYYHYWFRGRRVLERPFEEVLDSGEPKFPFCLCWANENWTRGWDGRSGETLLAQAYTFEDDVAHIRSLFSAFSDPRYIRINGKPLFLVYRTELLPNPLKTVETWRNEVRKVGFADLYLARVESFVMDVPPQSIGFDAAVEFAPDWQSTGVAGRRTIGSDLWSFWKTTGTLTRNYQSNLVLGYQSLARSMLGKPSSAYTRFRCVTPSWDNSPRRKAGAVIFHGSTPEKYGTWLSRVITETAALRKMEEQFVFINAWNEWGEGSHLEPDQRWGRAYLEATRQAFVDSAAVFKTPD
jgi:lipopolysaccharide biosynthesis protein